MPFFTRRTLRVLREKDVSRGPSQGCRIPYRLSKEFLEQETAKRASDSPSEGEKRVKSLRGLSNREAQGRQHIHVCRDPVGITKVMKTFQGFREEKLRRKSDFMHRALQVS